MITKNFVGRNNEISRIREWLEKSTGGLVLITGIGGIGKSSLLQKIEKEYSADDRFAVDYFDLADQPMALINQAVHLMNSLGREGFPQFTQKLSELNTSSSETVSGDLEDVAVEIFVQELAADLNSQRKRLLRITDTYEIASRYSIYGDDWAGGINEKLRDIPNAIFILAGRDKFDGRDILKEFYPKLAVSFGLENILHITLSGFNDNEMEEFFAECDKHRMIPQEMREKLHLLTDGRPVLLSLAVEWLQKNIPLPLMIEKSLTELRDLIQSESARDDLLNNFEFELVSKVRQLQSPLDIATLYMAEIDRRMDSKLLSILMDVDNSEAEKDLQELMELPFVKEYIGSEPPKCALHDEMRELVKKHAWQYLDISGEERKRLTRKVIEKYYQPQIDSLIQQNKILLRESHPTLLQEAQANACDQERWHLEAETVYYSSKLSEMEGFVFFDQAFYDKEFSYIRDQFLLDELKRAGLNKDKIALREADNMRRHGQIEEARQICLIVLEKEKLDDIDRVHGHNTLGSIDAQSNPGAAEGNFHKALELARLINDIRYQMTIHNNLGRLYRNTSQLEQAISHFEQALALARRSGNLDMSAIRNNLASIYRLNGNLDQADTLCSLSIAEHRKQGRERPLAYAYLTKADIDRDRGELQNAERYSEQALNLFNRLEDKEGSAQAYRTLANIHRHLFNFEQALRYLRSGILLVEDRNPFLLASLHQLYGRTYRHYASYLRDEMVNTGNDRSPEISSLYRDALAALQESIRLAQKIGNRWEVARSQLEIALIMLLNDEHLDEKKLNELLNQVWQTASELDDPLLKGYVYENRASIEMRNKRYFEAGRAFGEAAYHLTKRTGHEATKAFTRLQNILLNPNFSNQQSNALAEGVREQIQKQDYQNFPKLTALVNLCEQILDLHNLESEA